MKKTFLRSLWLILLLLSVLCLIGIFWNVRNKRLEEKQEELLHTQTIEEYTKETEVKETEQEETVKAELPVDFTGLQELNPDIYAWLTIPETNIDYPILQYSGEDQGFYLTHDINGEKKQAGSIYTENYNQKDFTDPNTILYGHNMKNGSMFHNVRYFADPEYFAEHSELYIYLPDRILKYRMVSCYETDDRHLLGSYDFSDEEVYAEYLEEIMNPRSMSAVVDETVELTTEDRLVTLSTCVANKPNNRRLLQAVLVEEIEAEYRGLTEDVDNE